MRHYLVELTDEQLSMLEDQARRGLHYARTARRKATPSDPWPAREPEVYRWERIIEALHAAKVAA